MKIQCVTVGETHNQAEYVYRSPWERVNLREGLGLLARVGQEIEAWGDIATQVDWKTREGLGVRVLGQEFFLLWYPEDRTPTLFKGWKSNCWGFPIGGKSIPRWMFPRWIFRS